MPITRFKRGLLCAAVIACLGLTNGVLASRQAQPEDVAIEYVGTHRQQFGLTGADVRDVVVSSVVRSEASGTTHVYLQQQHRGIPVWGGIFTVNVLADGTVVHAGGRFVANIAAATAGQQPRRSGIEAAGAAARGLGLRPSRPFEELPGIRSEGRVMLSDGGIATRPIEGSLVWYPTEEGAVRLAWRLDIEETDSDYWWEAIVDAETGELIDSHNLVVHDDLQATAFAISHPHAGEAGAAAILDPGFPATDGASYTVYPLPFESPYDGGRALVTDVAHPVASPFGWHDTDGIPGPEFTRTRGNNVHAYADRLANNLPDPGSDPDGGPGLLFDFPLDLAQGPETYTDAAVVNLFYWNNVMHDIAYVYGFDEVAGNFQVNNYGRGGLGGDDVRAEAQDGGGTNNANFATPADGQRPRMQMYVWSTNLPDRVVVAPPSPAAGAYAASRAAFGPNLGTTGPIVGDVVLATGGQVDPADGCLPFAVPAGAIAMVDRGTCPFTQKVKNAQDGGAAAVIVANNVAGAPITMGGADPSITIPSLMVSLDHGNVLRANLPLQATLEDGMAGAPPRDSSLDAGVIAHEYGHGISNRLTGGPNVVNCLNNAEQMGEGWSDWFGIALTSKAGDTALTPRGVGNYVTFRPTDGVGIRPTPYSTDMTVNPATYASVANPSISQPHGIGYVWNTMLWEVHWNLVHKHGYAANPYDGHTAGGNNLAMQLVMDGMKFQVCRPGFVDGRDAILAADVALTGGANQCEIWRGFAKRGLGFSADQGSSLNRFDGVEAFDLPAACTVASFGGFLPPLSNPPVLNAARAGSTVPVKFTLTGAQPQVDTQPVDCDTLQPTGEAPIALSSPGNSRPRQVGDQFHHNWQTQRAWAGTCRAVTVRIPAEADGVTYLRFH